MKTIKTTLFLILTLLISHGVDAQNAIVGNGQITKEQRTLDAFDKLTVRVGMRVKITTGDATIAELEGESNMLEHVITNVKNGELTVMLAQNKSYNQTKAVTVTIHVAKLAQVQVSTGCTVESDLPIRANTLTAIVETGSRLITPVNVKNLMLTVKDGSQASLDGTAAEADIQLSGAGKLNAEKLIIKQASLHLNGASRANIHVTGTLSAIADGVSVLNYSGNPTVKSQEANGLSKINKQGK